MVLYKFLYIIWNSRQAMVSLIKKWNEIKITENEKVSNDKIVFDMKNCPHWLYWRWYSCCRHDVRWYVTSWCLFREPINIGFISHKCIRFWHFNVTYGVSGGHPVKLKNYDPKNVFSCYKSLSFCVCWRRVDSSENSQSIPKCHYT